MQGITDGVVAQMFKMASEDKTISLEQFSDLFKSLKFKFDAEDRVL